MDPIHTDEEKESSEKPYSAYLNGINGEPELLPRVGDQYQAHLPLLLTRGFESEPHVVTFGLPIPLMWVKSEKFRGFRESDHEKPEEPCAIVKPRSVVLALPCQRNSKFKFDWLDKSLYPFPGALGESWQDAEEERFLLGLYFLGKNLALLQRFLGTKKMGDTLSYYYGSFYGSDEYKRWVDGRKSRTKRSVQGHKLLSGWRQTEFVSRLSSHLSAESKSTLLKVSKSFREEKITLEEYVFTLKDVVGIDKLTEAIGIGKGKKDLTNCALEPTKPSHGSSSSEIRIRNDLPIGDIVKYLTGEYRMSKTRSSDLFWEAVWPRLLARGWHSEQPKDGPRNSLVFLVPEANKFSRRKLSKGNHYFDSLTDVLKRVASDPTLLELKSDEDGEERVIKEEKIKSEPDINIELSDDSSANKKQKKMKMMKKKRYLQPRSKASSSKAAVLFTIVDTSNGCTLKELRPLPVETNSSIANSPSCLGEPEEDNLSESKTETRANKPMTLRVCGGGGSISSGKSSSVNMDNAMSGSNIIANERETKNRKGGRPRKQKLPISNIRSSLAKCTSREPGCSEESQYMKKKKKPVKKGTQMRPKPSEEADQTLKHSSAGSLEEDSSCGRNEDRGISQERPETRQEFDLNVSQEADTVITEVVENSESSCGEQASVQMDVEMQCKPQVTADMLPGRRQSTRTRPLTTRALEAFAFGYLDNPKKKRKATEEESRTKSKKRVHRHSLVSNGFRNGTREDGSNTDEN